MRFSVDAHAIGQHLTGNETYIRNLLNCFDVLDREADFVAYISRQDAFDRGTRAISEEARRGESLSCGSVMICPGGSPKIGRICCTCNTPARFVCAAPIVVSVHDVSFLEHPEYFTPFRALQLRLTVRRTVKSAACVLTPSEFSKRRILDAYQLGRAKGGRVAERCQLGLSSGGSGGGAAEHAGVARCRRFRLS